MAKNAPLASLYAETSEDQALVDDIKQSYAKLRQALDEREKQPFDPVLLAMAQGFLSPTKTGSFGEALGNVAALVGPAQQAEEKRAAELASMRMDLAQRELAQRQATRGEAEFRRLLGAGQVPATRGLPSEMPAGAAAPTQPQGRSVTSQDIARLASMPGMAERAKILQDMVKADRDRLIISMNGIVFDRDTGRYLDLPIPGQKQEPFTTRYGRFEMTPYEYSQYQRAEQAGQGKEWLDNFRGVTPTGAPERPAVRPTVAQATAEAKGAETKATETAKAEVGRTQEVIESGSDATGRLAQYASLRSIASRPDANQIFGIFNRPDVATAILNLVQEGVQSPGQTSIRAGALEDTLRNVGLPQEQIDRYRFALSTMANIQLQQAKLAAGQGAISNFERQLFADAVISPRDNPATILAKLSMMEARAQFDRTRASALRRSKMSADEYVETPEYKKMVDDYLKRAAEIAGRIGVRTERRAAPAAQSFNPAAQQLRNELGIR